MLQINSITTEEDIFKYLIKRDDYSVRKALSNMSKFLDRIKENIFTEEWAMLYEIIAEASKNNIPLTYDFYQDIVLPNVDFLINLPNVTLFSDDKKMSLKEKREKVLDLLLITFDNLAGEYIEDEDYLESAMELYIQAWAREAYEKTAYNGIQILNDGFKPKGSRRVYKGTEDYHDYSNNSKDYIASIVNNDAGLLDEDIDTSKDTIDDINKKIEVEQLQNPVAITGIDSLDKELTNLYKGEIAIIQAGTGVGKTRFTSQIAYNGMSKFQSKVLFITMEQKASRILPMFISRHIASKKEYVNLKDMSDKNIIRNTYAPENRHIIDEAMEDIVNETDMIGRIKITGRSLLKNDLKRYLEKVWDEGFHFDILVLDYIGLMEIDKNETRYEAITGTINMLKNLCKNFKGEGFLAIIPNQLTPDGEKEVMKGNNDTSKSGGSGSQDISRAGDNILTIYQTEDMKANSEMSMVISKIRLGEAIPVINMHVDLGKCLFFEKEEEDYGDDDF